MRRALLAALVLIASTLTGADPKEAPPPPGTPPGEPEKLFQAGEALFKKGQQAVEGKLPLSERDPSFRQAISTFEDLIARHPKTGSAAKGAYMTGTCYLYLEEPRKALEAYQRVIDKYPESGDRVAALLRSGVCHSALQEPAKARLLWAQVVQQFSGRTEDVKRAQKYIQELDIVGKPAPALRTSQWMLGLAGDKGLQQFQGEVVVLIFFATWCPNCQKEWPHLRYLMETLEPKGAIFLGVANPEDSQSKEGVEPYIRRNNLEFMDVALDPREASWVPYRVFGFPAAVVIDRKGEVRWRGHPTFLMRPLIEKLLAER